MKVNYQLMLDREIQQITAAGRVPKLLLHSCCAPCSSYVLEYLSQYFDITVLYYNPNISPAAEFEKRATEQEKLVASIPTLHPVTFLCGHYDPSEFTAIAKGLEDLPEGGERCTKCYRLRLEETAKLAKELGYDYFTTTLSISPLKDAERLNTIGGELAERYGVAYLYSDFKKKEGYKRSIQLSADYNLYRQDYCGCIYSKRDAANRRNQQK